MSRPFSVEDCDFGGWATRNDLRCSDGRVIRRDAFKGNDGIKVPLVWNHQHNDPRNVLGHAWLENREEGVYTYGFFNDTEAGEVGKVLVKHGDICALSIYANQLQQNGPDVVHGCICEVSLVHKGANPGAFIDSMLQHGENSEDEAIIYTGMPLSLAHSDTSEKEDKKDEEEKKNTDAEGKKNEDEETIADVVNSMSEKQQNVMCALIAQALESEPDNKEENSENNKEDESMKHNVFDNDQQNQANVLSHADQAGIISMAKSNSVGSLRTAMEIYAEQNPNSALAHGIDNIDVLFPDYKDVRPGAPEMITTDQGWVNKVLQKVHKSPISRIRTRQADIRNIENLRARGYKKGTKKSEVGNFGLIHRTTDPQTVYVKSKLDRDDIVDIQDFDVVQYLYAVDRMNLNEELATAIMISDGREVGADGKIAEDKIRPIWQDDELYTIHADVDITGMKTTLQGTNTSANFGENYIYAEAVIQSLLYAREKYKGSGTPDFYCTPHLVNVMLLSRDLNGRRVYDKVSDLAAALNVGEIITAEQFEGKTRTTSDGKTKKLLGLMVNLADYSLGATKGGEITHFTDFDIDFNQEKSLLETRCSGANTRVMSAIALEEDVTKPVNPTPGGDT
jgi:caudovirus prohead protease|nr:MAG TPA: major capsid protein [Caudoviricetes sp.]